MMYYYLVDADAPHGQVFWTCSRPIPGQLVGWRNGMGYGVYNVALPFIQEAKDLDAHPMMPTTKEGWLSLVDRALRKRSFGEFGLQNYYDMFSDRDEAELVAAEDLVDEIRLVTIEPA